MKKHPEIGYRIAQASSELTPIAEGILHHHEWWNGSGYPQGLKKDEIPLISRIIAIVDAYDVMTHTRPYKEAKTKTKAIEEIKKCSGKQFDPYLVDKFLEIIKEEII
jgi:HD-GYP domain-containing protein (c-di-GMP phosphodiesterase class II)